MTLVILGEVSRERARQDAKWGGIPGIDRNNQDTYAAVLGEEFGECCKAWLERDMPNLREELIQVAAVAVAWVEEIEQRRRAATPVSERPTCACHGQPMWRNGSCRGVRRWVCRIKEGARNAERIRVGPGIFVGRSHQFNASKQDVKDFISRTRKEFHGTSV